MSRIFSLVVAFAVLGLAACSTKVERHTPAPAVITSGVTVSSIESSAVGGVPGDVPHKLETAIYSKLSGHAAGGTPVKLKVTVTKYDIKSGGTRFIGGALAGSNKMTASVEVLDASGTTIDSFTVERSSNPGGYGMFYDQATATIDAVAEGIVDGLTAN